MGESVILDLPFTYEISAVFPRCRLASPLIVKEYVTVALPVISGSDAPETTKIETAQGEVLYRYRAYRDGLYGAVLMPAASGEPRSAMTPQRVAELQQQNVALTWDDYPLPLVSKMGREHLNHPTRDAVELKQVVVDGREEAVHHAMRAATRLIIVDGIVHTPSEPAWLVRRHLRDCIVSAEPLNLAKDSGYWFRGDRYRDAERFARAYRRPTQGNVVIQSRIVGTGPFKFDAVVATLRTAMTDLEGTLSGQFSSTVYRLPLPFFEQFDLFRRAISAPDPAEWNKAEAIHALGCIHSMLEVRPPEMNGICSSIRSSLAYHVWRLQNLDDIPRPVADADEEAIAGLGA